MFGENNNGGTKVAVVDKYLKWAGSEDDWFFGYREDGQNIQHPFKKGVLIRKQFQVQGWDTASNSWAQCNKVDNIGEEPFNIFIDKKPVFNWKYSKEEIENLGLKLNLLVTVLDEVSWEVLELSLKGKGFGSFVEFEKTFDSNALYFCLGEPESGKAGAIKYKTPTFKEAWPITDEHKEAATEVVSKIKANKESYNKEASSNEEISTEDIPF